MKITLIRPNIGRLEHSLFVDEARMEPLELAVLAGLSPPGVEVAMYDDRLEGIPYDEPTDLAAISVQTFTARRAYEIAAKYRRRGVPVILGGMHPTLAPEEAARHADAVYLGDAEGLWPQVVADARAGKLRPVYQASIGVPHPGVRPDRSVYRGKRYLPITLLQFGRGCLHGCTYCATGAYSGRTHHLRPVAEVVAEIEGQPRRGLFFVDDNIVADHRAAKELFQALIPLKIRWVSQASIDMTWDRELMELMARSGCLGQVIGFESLDARNLEGVRKEPNLVSATRRYREELAILRDYGLQTWAAFTLGYDHDTVEGIEELLEFAVENRFTFAAFNVLMPYPGTPFYRDLEREGRLLYDGAWWLHPEYRFNFAAFRPKRMSAEELTEVGAHCRRRFNSPGSLLFRLFDLKTNLRSPLRFGIYLAYTPLFRRETFKKHGMRLGLSR